MWTGTSAAGLRAFVTGGGGFVGSYLVAALRSVFPDIEIVVGSRAPTGRGEIFFDLLDPISIRNAVRELKPALVCHLAGEASVSAASRSIAATWRVNTAATLDLGTAVAKFCPEALFFFTSSAEIYGDAFLDGEVSEVTFPRPNSVYGRSKFAAEQVLADVLGDAALVTVRPTNHIGPGQAERFAVASFARQIATAERGQREAIINVGNIDTQRDFMDVRDVVEAYISLLSRARESGSRQTYNVSSGRLCAVGDLLKMMQRFSTASTSIRVDSNRVRKDELRMAAVASEKIHRETSWHSKVSIEDTLKSILDWSRQNAN